jgi:AAA+ ATPase superfamily predicted ATPase
VRNVTGNPVDGDDFFGRDDELERLKESVLAGNHVLLVGPRRVGKSSLVAELARILGNDGWAVVKVADEAAFLHEIHEAVLAVGLPIRERVTEVIRSFHKAVRGSKVSAASVSVECRRRRSGLGRRGGGTEEADRFAAGKRT